MKMLLFCLQGTKPISILIWLCVIMTSYISLTNPVYNDSGGMITNKNQNLKELLTVKNIICSNYTIIKPAGVTFSLECNPTCELFTNSQWYKNMEYSGNGSSLNVTSSGNYKCEMCNGIGCQSATKCVIYTVNFLEWTVINKSHEYLNQSVTFYHQEITFQCPPSNPDDNSTNLHLKKINLNIMKSKLLLLSNDTDETLKSRNTTLQNPRKKDEGWYVCLNRNVSGATSYFYTNLIIQLNKDSSSKISPWYSRPTTIVITILGISFIGALVIILSVCHRLENERKKKCLALEVAERALLNCQYAKKIMIEKRYISDGLSALPMETQFVKIERQELNDTETSPASEFILDVDPKWEFPRNKLQLAEGLGEGAFGKVVKGIADGILQGNVTNIVAVKMLKECYTDSDMIVLVSEMEIMKMIGTHEHILKLLGCCSQDGGLLVITEYAPHGNLRDFLRQHHLSIGDRHSPSNDKFIPTERILVVFAHQIAKGMEYLASKKCIHRDLAARNILVADNYTMKISDFGLAKNVHDTDYYRKTSNGRLPVKWMAPEALFHKVYTIQSDVWSYGILLWEIMTLGGVPYASVPNIEKLLQLLRAGYRMEKPPHCPLPIFYIMRDCWSYGPDDRPLFSVIVNILNELLLNNEIFLPKKYSEMKSLCTVRECDDDDDNNENDNDDDDDEDEDDINY